MVESAASAAKDLASYDESALIELLGLRTKAMVHDAAVAGNFSPEITYDAKFLGPLDDIKALGMRILSRWNKELFKIVCGSAKDDEEERGKILSALSLGEGAAIGALIPVLVGLGLAPTLAAVLAAIVVKRFLGSAVDTICEAWGKQVEKA